VRRWPTALALALALALPACGSDDEDDFDPIPSRQAEALVTQLAQVEERIDAESCGGARFQITGGGQLRDKVERLPRGVDPELRDALEEGLDRLLELVEEDCDRISEERRRDREQTDTETTETDTTPTEPIETDTTPTEPPPTETEPPPTEPPPTEPEETEPPLTTPGGNVPPGQDGGTPAPKEDR
jgi:hypothetical protein